MLITPLIAFLLMMFVVPLAFILVNSVYIPGISNGLPNFYRALMADEAPVPGESVFRSLAQDILAARKAGGLPRILKPLRHQDRLVWRLFTRTSRKLPSQFNRPVKEWFVSHDKKWAEPETWTITRRVARHFTPYYFINSVDLEHKASGEFRIKKKGARVYLGVLSNTFEISFFVTVFTFILGYPLAYWLATMSERKANLFMICILLPFWTSFLVRTYVWILILQTEGPLNSILLWTGFIDEPLSLIHNRFSVYVAMTHVLLPFMVLPIYSVMKSIPSSHMRAAESMGAHPLRAFRKVYFPQTLHGVGAGSLLVFIVALGYYITPALVGGAKDTMISMVIADNINILLNWGMAGALGIMLLVVTLAVYILYTGFLRLAHIRLT